MKEQGFSVFRRRFLFLSVGLLFGLLLFLFLDRYDIFDYLFICPLHVLGLYCPTCGMTRAAHALLSLDLRAALAYNPCIFPLGATALWYASFGTAALIKGDEKIFRRAGKWPILSTLALLLLWFLTRNILLLGFGIDLIGDFSPA